MNNNEKNKIKFAIICFAISFSIFVVNKIIIFKNQSNIKINNLALNIGKTYYEKVFYKSFSNDYELLKNYESKGIAIDIDTAILNINYKIEDNKLKNCNLVKSYLYIYPKSPYKINNYKIKTKLSC